MRGGKCDAEDRLTTPSHACCRFPASSPTPQLVLGLHEVTKSEGTSLSAQSRGSQAPLPLTTFQIFKSRPSFKISQFLLSHTSSPHPLQGSRRVLSGCGGAIAEGEGWHPRPSQALIFHEPPSSSRRKGMKVQPVPWEASAVRLQQKTAASEEPFSYALLFLLPQASQGLRYEMGSCRINY